MNGLGVLFAYAAAAAATFVVGRWDLVWKFLQSDDGPAWIQAIGAIGAIVGAFLVADRQHKVAARQKRTEEIDEAIRKLQIVSMELSGAAAVAALLESFLPRFAQESWPTMNLVSRLLDSGRAIKALPVFEIPSANTVFFMGGLSHALVSLHDVWRDAIDPDAAVSAPALKALPTECASVRLALERAMHQCSWDLGGFLRLRDV